MKKSVNKLIAASLVTTMGLGYINYPVYAQEETEVNVPNTVEDGTEQEQTDIVEEPDIETDENTDVKEPVEDTENVVEDKANIATDEVSDVQTSNEVETNVENNAGDFNVTGNGSGWIYDESSNTLTFNTSGDYAIIGNGVETTERIIIASNFIGNITIENININVSETYNYIAFNIDNTSSVTLTLNGNNVLKSGGARAGLEFSNASKNRLTITGNGSLEAYGGSHAAGIGGNYGFEGNNITINSGKIVAVGGSGAAGIGGGFAGYPGGSGKNITITGGKVTAIGASSAAGIGGGAGGKAENIIISGGTITATGGMGIGGNPAHQHQNIVISGGSVKASSIGTVPTDGNGKNVYLAKIEGLSGVDKVNVDDFKIFARAGNHPNEDGAFYLYLTGENHRVYANEKSYRLSWNNGRNSLQQDNIIPTVKIASKTSTSITVQPLENQNIYGIAEYSIDNTHWQPNNVFNNLDADKEYTIYARYQENDAYLQSKSGTTTETTMKDGSILIIEPSGLKATYEKKLSDVSLPLGWTWVNEDTSLSVGSQTYFARFDTTRYENEYDFTGVDGYDDVNHYVKVALTVNVSKAQSTVTITTERMDKAYDGQAVSEPEVEKTGSTNTVTFTWYKKDGNGWIKLDEYPVNTGIYKVVATVEADDNYNGTTAEKEFTISQATNEWTSELSIADWTHGQTASTPVATAKYGNVVFTYSDKEEGTYTDKVPTAAGTWYVKATVEGNNNYIGLKKVLPFEIKKADSLVEFTVDSLDKTYDGVSVFAPTRQTGSSHVRVLTWYKDNNGVWEKIETAPTDAGHYKVVATVEGNSNFNSAQTEMIFEIKKAVPSYTLPTGLSVEQGATLSNIRLPEGFTWIDATQKVDTLGTQSFKAIFTPEDTTNYQLMEVDISVEVVPASTTDNKTSDNKSEAPKKNSSKNETQTSTQTNVVAWTVLGLVSLGALLAVLFKRKHQ